MSKFFENESQRQLAFIDILRSHSIGIVPSSFAGYHTDGDLHVNGRRYMILEVKSEVGSKGAEPYCQAILYYVGGSRDEVEKASKMDAQFNFPCLIITLFGRLWYESISLSADEIQKAPTLVSRVRSGLTAPITRSSPPFCLCFGIQPIPQCADAPLAISVHSQRRAGR